MITSVLLFNSCNAVNKTITNNNVTKEDSVKVLKNIVQESPIVIYDSHTRGYHFTFSVYETYATAIKEYNGKPIKVDVSSKDVKELKSIIKQIAEKEIASHEAPTKKRHYDGAPHTTITIFKKGEKYSSQTFDGGFPPKALEVLVNKVLSLSPEK
jgi:predicted translin family RNA/ssDNA-binding protein